MKYDPAYVPGAVWTQKRDRVRSQPRDLGFGGGAEAPRGDGKDDNAFDAAIDPWTDGTLERRAVTSRTAKSDVRAALKRAIPRKPRVREAAKMSSAATLLARDRYEFKWGETRYRLVGQRSTRPSNHRPDFVYLNAVEHSERENIAVAVEYFEYLIENGEITVLVGLPASWANKRSWTAGDLVAALNVLHARVG